MMPDLNAGMPFRKQIEKVIYFTESVLNRYIQNFEMLKDGFF
jgi:hypothetical protein